jgi:hypothetical protein
MDVATIQQYPRFTSMVKDLRRFVQNNPDVLNALLQLTGYSSSEVLNSLTWGKGPKIVVEDFPAQFGQLKGASRQIAGKYLRGSDPNTIHINANWVRGIEQAVIKENYQATAFFLATVVLHEYVHEGRFQNNLSPTLCDTQKDYYSCEAGWVFSKQAFGVLITPQNAYQYSFQFFGKQ